VVSQSTLCRAQQRVGWTVKKVADRHGTGHGGTGGVEGDRCAVGGRFARVRGRERDADEHDATHQSGPARTAGSRGGTAQSRQEHNANRGAVCGRDGSGDDPGRGNGCRCLRHRVPSGQHDAFPRASRIFRTSLIRPCTVMRLGCGMWNTALTSSSATTMRDPSRKSLGRTQLGRGAPNSMSVERMKVYHVPSHDVCTHLTAYALNRIETPTL